MALLASLRSQLLITAISTRSPLNSRVPVKGLLRHSQIPIFFSPSRYRFNRTSCMVPSGSTDRKSTRLNSSHLVISYAVFCLKKKNTKPSEAEIVFLAGWLGHYVGDGSQPLHTSIQYNGWVGPNPHGYSFFFLMIRLPPRSTLFPNTTPFR